MSKDKTIYSIHKYKIKAAPNITHEIFIPKYSKLMKIGIQEADCIIEKDNIISLWFMSDASSIKVKRKFVCFETGRQLSKNLLDTLQYIDTVQFNYGSYILHLFEEIPDEQKMIESILKIL